MRVQVFRASGLELVVKLIFLEMALAAAFLRPGRDNGGYSVSPSQAPVLVALAVLGFVVLPVLLVVRWWWARVEVGRDEVLVRRWPGVPARRFRRGAVRNPRPGVLEDTATGVTASLGFERLTRADADHLAHAVRSALGIEVPRVKGQRPQRSGSRRPPGPDDDGFR